MTKESKITTIISTVIGVITSIVFGILFAQYGGLALANLGFESAIIKLADESRMYGTYDIAAKMYDKISEKDNEYSTYANAALGEIYSSNAMNNNYKKAFEYYKKAFDESNNDPIILKSCLKFVLIVVDEANNELDTKKKVFDIHDESFLDFACRLFNACATSDEEYFRDLKIDFEFDEGLISDIFSGIPIKGTTTKWEYVSTKYDYDSTLSFVNSYEKLLLVDSIAELESKTDASIRIVYKYYRYKGTKITHDIDLLDTLEWVFFDSKEIYLTEIDINEEKETEND